MNEKDFKRLRRQDFLELLLTQSQELMETQEKLDTTASDLARALESNERLKARLDEKDALIERLKDRLDSKDSTISDLRARMNTRRIELAEAGSIAMASLKLNGVFEAAQRAADQYLENLKMRGLDHFPVDTAAAEAEEAARQAEEAREAEEDAELARQYEEDRAKDEEAEAPEEPPAAEPPAEEKAPEAEEPPKKRGLFGRFKR